jgi:glycosidase
MKNLIYISLSIAFLLLLFAFACNNAEPKKDEKEKLTKDTLTSVVKAGERTKDAVIYEVNIRQYTEEGTFESFEKHIPRLDSLGVDILWLMPIYPISEKGRKGELGSYYAIADYKGINPNFGTEEDLKSLIETAHQHEMLVILDWVANHTGRDHHWTEEHPEWYTKDSTGAIAVPEGTDWTDVADLNYDNKEMRKAMTDAMVYWVNEFDVDGYRCDVAGMVPTDFWNNLRPKLEEIKPVFMLAEAEQLDLHEKAFEMGYAWHLHHVMNNVASGKQNADSLRKYFKNAKEKYPQEVYRMSFTSNHDENSWNGTVFERMPNSYKTFAALTFTAPGMPLIYSGQEAGLDKRLAFFKKDTIEWKKHEMSELYKKLARIKTENPALHNGAYGGEINFIKTTKDNKIFAFSRTKDDNTVVSVFNMSDQDAEFKIKATEGTFKDALSGEEIEITKNTKMNLVPWGYKILTEKSSAR